MKSDSQRLYNLEYKKRVEVLRVDLYPTDEDIKLRLLEKLKEGEPKATYIKRLIREDLKKSR